MVDEDRVLRLLDRIRTDVDQLAEQAKDPPGSDDAIRLAGIKYLFITAIGGCAKIAHHIAAASDWPAAESNGDAVRTLGRRGVVPAALADRVASAVGFRNVLVHQYAEVDDRYTLAHLDQLDDLRDFVAAVARWLLGRP